MRKSWIVLTGQVLPVVAGFVLSGGLVWQASHSAFTATTSNTGNSVGAATLNLTNDSTGPLFAITNAVPGTTGSRCIQISSTSPVASAVKLYTAAGTAPANNISAYVGIRIERGSGGTYDSCTNFTPAAEVFDNTLANLITRTNYDNGIGPWALSGTTTTETMSFRVTWTFATNAPDTTQGGSTPTVTLTWEAQS
ncbi:hypothetical protein [Actinophytocola sp.]|uniref:hypothetical protein n=1 Tax=Actinophytocola sp. TaxID=1872138 RepID=UPI002ED497C9